MFVLFFKQLLTQICLALSTLLLHAIERGKPIEKLFYSLQNLQSADNGNIAVLEMLTVLPEVVEDHISNCCKSLKHRYEYEQEVLSLSFVIFLYLWFWMSDWGPDFASHTCIIL